MLGVKFGRMDALKKFLASGRSEIYLKVSEEGQVGAGDTAANVKDPNQVTISDIVRVYARDREDIKTMQRSQRRDLEGWKHYFLEHTKRMEKTGLREGEEMRRYIAVESVENCSPLQTKKYGLSRDRSKIADP